MDIVRLVQQHSKEYVCQATPIVSTSHDTHLTATENRHHHSVGKRVYLHLPRILMCSHVKWNQNGRRVSFSLSLSLRSYTALLGRLLVGFRKSAAHFSSPCLATTLTGIRRREPKSTCKQQRKGNTERRGKKVHVNFLQVKIKLYHS